MEGRGRSEGLRPPSRGYRESEKVRGEREQKRESEEEGERG